MNLFGKLFFSWFTW